MVDSGADPPLPVFGWREQIALPDWGIDRMRAKLDTGARTSALHVEDYEEIGEGQDGALPTVRFHVLVGPRDRPRRVEVVTPVVGHSIVRDTRARPERRPVVRTRVVCGPLDATVDVNLTDRSGMNFRMLLGRLALSDRAVVDPASSFLVSPAPRGFVPSEAAS